MCGYFDRFRIFAQFLVIVGSFWNVDSLATECFATKSAFVSACATRGGVVDGGRCFFVDSSTGDWDHAWATCRAEGATLAQIHTVNEMNAVISLGQTLYGSADQLLIALQDSSVLSLLSLGLGCLQISKERWYQDTSTPDSSLNVMDTMEKYFHCGSQITLSILTPRCYSVNWKDGDCAATYWHPVCSFENQLQYYTLSGKCMTETVAQTVSGRTPEDCANSCVQETWCRSFNLIYYGDSNSNNRCQLFSRSYHDCSLDPNKCPDVIDQTPTCFHYDYDV